MEFADFLRRFSDFQYYSGLIVCEIQNSQFLGSRELSSWHLDSVINYYQFRSGLYLYLGFAEKVLWVRVGVNPPLAPPPPRRERTESG
ncbi:MULTISPECIES: hypothetical protein [Okeania]|uniref:Uncharacterized protein n=1 Tax=Okeania hirsuta TaxID=1458930 RepID=A0A3N6Q6G2_9CYAN|nr:MULTISPECIES: hypothetical protein [Okeania]NET12193.1 hypothetical protein [Okeania sp. SIO1H6]NET19745.1 hypothetical protein [Okeania sp. SIO1H5]NET74576.1 hypothetical protein [Okeania sp. SIO1F9]NET96342.1 hypothetical protein [Okeania sp. SIO1H2]RQH26039.1 hypothetical protein D5R40_28675 [Okeania hirsuta]